MPKKVKKKILKYCFLFKINIKVSHMFLHPFVKNIVFRYVALVIKRLWNILDFFYTNQTFNCPCTVYPMHKKNYKRFFQFLLIKSQQRNWDFADLRYFNQQIWVLNIKGLQHRVLKILRFKYWILFQRLNSFHGDSVKNESASAKALEWVKVENLPHLHFKTIIIIYNYFFKIPSAKFFLKHN